MSDAERHGKAVRQCPRCKSTFVEWDPFEKRFRCLVNGCGWRQQEPSNPGTYCYFTGSVWEDKDTPTKNS